MIDEPNQEPDPGGEVSDEAERVRAVAAFLRDQEEKAVRAKLAEVRSERFHKVRNGALVVAWMGVAYVWLGTPKWLTIEPAPVPTVAEEAASLRLNVFLQTQKVEAYRTVRGRLPYVLDEAGPRFRGMEYRRRDSQTYEITGRSQRVELLYESRVPPLEFVGVAADLADNEGTGSSQ